MIGSFGDVQFTVSMAQVRTFKNYKRSGGARWDEHDLINRKPLGEFKGAGLEELTFAIQLHSSLGVVPEDELDTLRRMRDSGKSYVFVLGESPIGDNNWVITNISETSDFINHLGQLQAVTAELTLKEYVVSMGGA